MTDADHDWMKRGEVDPRPSFKAGEAPLIRDPAEWAREWGWISPRRAKNIASKLDQIAWTMENAMDGDEGVTAWARDIRRIARKVAPKRVRA